MRPVVRGDPAIDEKTLDHVKDLALKADSLSSHLRSPKVWKNIDGLTSDNMQELLHSVSADVSRCQAVLSRINRIRKQQQTAISNGGRRRSRART